MFGYIDISELMYFTEFDDLWDSIGQEVNEKISIAINPYDVIKLRDTNLNKVYSSVDSSLGKCPDEIIYDTLNMKPINNQSNAVIISKELKRQNYFHPIIKIEFELEDILDESYNDVLRDDNLYFVTIGHGIISSYIDSMKDVDKEFHLFVTSRKSVRLIFSVAQMKIYNAIDSDKKYHLSCIPTLNSPNSYNYINRNGKFLNDECYASCERMDTTNDIGIVNASMGKTNLINKSGYTAFDDMVIGTAVHYKALEGYLVVHKKHPNDMFKRTKLYTFIDYNFKIMYETTNKRKADLYVKYNLANRYGKTNGHYTFLEKCILCCNWIKKHIFDWYLSSHTLPTTYHDKIEYKRCHSVIYARQPIMLYTIHKNEQDAHEIQIDGQGNNKKIPIKENIIK